MSASQRGRVLAHSSAVAREAAATPPGRRKNGEPYAWSPNRLALLSEMLKDGHDPADFAGLARILNGAYPAGRAAAEDIADKVAQIVPRKNEWDRFLQSDINREFEAVLARARAIARELGKGKQHNWTDGETDYLISQRRRNPNWNCWRLALSLSTKFASASDITPEKVRRKIQHLSGEHPELRFEYDWSAPGREDLALRLREEGFTYREVAEAINDVFPGEPRATANMVDTLFQRMEREGKKAPKRRKLSQRYLWDDAKGEFALSLAREGKSSMEIAKRLNGQFDEGQAIKARPSTVRNFLKKHLPREQRPRSAYDWTGGRRDYLISIKKENPSRTCQELARMMNQKFPGARKADDKTIRRMLRELLKARPDEADALRPIAMENSRYPWDDEKDEFLITLMYRMPGLGHALIARMLERRFDTKVKPDINTVRNRLGRLAKQEPDLKPIVLQHSTKGSSYGWTARKEAFMRELLEAEPRPSFYVVADRLNERFPGGKAANYWTIKTKAKSLS
ncbi:MAG: hypothetical protein ABII71_05205 [Candidatus Micrarchaeota archaeon]